MVVVAVPIVQATMGMNAVVRGLCRRATAAGLHQLLVARVILDTVALHAGRHIAHYLIAITEHRLFQDFAPTALVRATLDTVALHAGRHIALHLIATTVRLQFQDFNPIALVRAMRSGQA